jgi:hypothetical protein
MLSLSQAFHQARGRRSQRPEVLITLVNAFGARVYGERLPSDQAAGLLSPPVADGTFLADGGARAGEGSLNLLDRGARVLSFGRVRESLTPDGAGLSAGLKEGEPGRLTVVLSNAGPAGGRPFSRMEGAENLLGAGARLLVGYPGLAAREYLTRFTGQVSSYRLEPERLTLTLEA